MSRQSENLQELINQVSTNLTKKKNPARKDTSVILSNMAKSNSFKLRDNIR